jgi:prepilin-type N-terminal cleavage/methylation domain-containing protein
VFRGDGVARQLGVLTMVRSQDGFTLPELLVALVLGLVVVGGAVSAMVSALHSQPQAQSRQAALQHARFTMERMTRELRQGSVVSISSANQIRLVTHVDTLTCGGAPATSSQKCQVTYTCQTNGTCTRQVALPTGAAPGPVTTVVRGLSTGNVFSYKSSPTLGNCDLSSATGPRYVCVTLPFPAKSGQNAITLTDGVALRNQ